MEDIYHSNFAAHVRVLKYASIRESVSLSLIMKKDGESTLSRVWKVEMRGKESKGGGRKEIRPTLYSSRIIRVQKERGGGGSGLRTTDRRRESERCPLFQTSCDPKPPSPNQGPTNQLTTKNTSRRTGRTDGRTRTTSIGGGCGALCRQGLPY